MTEVLTIVKAPSGPLRWRVQRGETMVIRCETKKLAEHYLALLGGDLSRAAEWYRLNLSYARRRMPERDALRSAVLSAQQMGFGPERVGACPTTGRPLEECEVSAL